MAGPLFTVTLYQRSSLASRRATRDAHTDSLTLHREQPRLRARARERARCVCGGRTRTLTPLSGRRRRLQADQRHLRPSARRPGARRGRAAPRDGDGLPRNVPLRRRRVRDRARLRRGPARARTSRRSTDASRSSQFSHGACATVSVGIATFPTTPRRRRPRARGRRRAVLGEAATARTASARTALRSPRRRAPRRSSGASSARRGCEPLRISSASSTRRTSTRAHTPSASRCSWRRSLGSSSCDDEQVEQLKLAGRLHDLGKIAIPDRVLQKPGDAHPARGATARPPPRARASLLDGMDIRPVDVWIRHHHEHWDGSGYPHGLAGEEIPFGSRVILVADAYDAITTERSYRDAATPADGDRGAPRACGHAVRPRGRRGARGAPRGRRARRGRRAGRGPRLSALRVA